MKQQRFFSLAILGLLLILCPFSSAAQSSDEVNALLDVSARHFLPGQVIKVDVQLNNHTSRLIKSRTRLQVVKSGGAGKLEYVTQDTIESQSVLPYPDDGKSS